MAATDLLVEGITGGLGGSSGSDGRTKWPKNDLQLDFLNKF